MLKRLGGYDGYARALDLYFTRHDGDAATIEDWLRVFEDATGRDLTQFKRWYSQAGTPRLKVSDDFKDGTYTLHFEQENPATPGQAKKDPMWRPIAVGLLTPNGDEVVPTTMRERTEARQSFSCPGLASRPIPSILRGFSAPVVLDRTTDAARAFDGTDIVLSAAEFGRFHHRRQDYEVPNRFGARQINGENGGPGAVFHTLRSVHNTMGICAAIEQHCPDAFLVNLSNPLSRVALAIDRHTSVRSVSMCHEMPNGIWRLSKFLRMDAHDIEGRASGINLSLIHISEPTGPY